ncbi:hypothetical protein VaNZ11_003005 [Volvox africanus]|uniref:Uncharacterized protein n=1 Tax=Volvox africanus TaxID=51714 RepID=A0ABQ5RTZ3_9CHLO|nr:hypothetical protein VaNZ11_003005 [Volvox africanus]
MAELGSEAVLSRSDYAAQQCADVGAYTGSSPRHEGDVHSSNEESSVHPWVPPPTPWSTDPSPLLQQRHGAEPLPYRPFLLLSTEWYELRGLERTDIGQGCHERLRRMVWSCADRHLVGASVGIKQESSCQVVLDMVEVLTDVAQERRKIPVGGSAAPTDWGSWMLQQLDDAPVKSRSQLDVTNVRAAIILRPWWAPRNLAWWGWSAITRAGAMMVHLQESLRMLSTGIRSTRSVNRRSCSGRVNIGSSIKNRQHADRRRAASAAGTAYEAKMDEVKSGALCRPVIASRIMSVTPRVVLLQKPEAGTQAQPPVSTGTGPCEQHLPIYVASFAHLQVAATVCCGVPIPMNAVVGSKMCHWACRAGRRLPDAIGEFDRVNVMSCTERGPLAEVMLRHGSRFARTCTLTEIWDPQGAGPGPLGPPKACRRAQCCLHLTLHQEIRLLDLINKDSAAVDAPDVEIDPEAYYLGPGLLLVGPRTRANPCFSGQRSIPVVLVDDPLVAAELQAALADKQGATCSPANWDDFLIDLGVFLMRTAELHRAADPVLQHVYAGRLRRGPAPPCRCGRRTQDISAMHVSSGGPGVTTTSSTQPCVACTLLQLREALNQYLSASRSLSLGERLLRHATASGWNHTASCIWSRLGDLQRIDALLGTGSRVDSQCCDHSNTTRTSRNSQYRHVQQLLRACPRVLAGMLDRQGADAVSPRFFLPYILLILILALAVAWILGGWRKSSFPSFGSGGSWGRIWLGGPTVVSFFVHVLIWGFSMFVIKSPTCQQAIACFLRAMQSRCITLTRRETTLLR